MNNLERALYQAAASTFEDLGFMFTSDEVSDSQLALPIQTSIGVNFTGPIRGTLELRVTDSVAESLTSNMLGEDTPPTDEMKQDALGELANVICGNFLPAVGGLKDIFRISSPQLLPLNTDSFTGLMPAADVKIGLDGGRADILIFFTEDHPEG